MNKDKKLPRKDTNQDPEPAYYAVIPAPILHDKEISSDAKILYAHIVTMARKHGYAYAPNSYYERVMGKSSRAVQRYLKQLVDSGHIMVDVVKKDTGTHRKIYLSDSDRVRTNLSGGVRQISHGGTTNMSHGYDKNVAHNNTRVNSTRSNSKDIVDFIDRCVEFLNVQTDSDFRVSTKKTRSLLTALHKDGYTLKDVKKVIRFKAAEWSNDQKMAKYLRPETLFNRTKFESYLNESKRTKGNQSGPDWKNQLKSFN